MLLWDVKPHITYHRHSLKNGHIYFKFQMLFGVFCTFRIFILVTCIHCSRCMMSVGKHAFVPCEKLFRMSNCRACIPVNLSLWPSTGGPGRAAEWHCWQQRCCTEEQHEGSLEAVVPSSGRPNCASLHMLYWSLLLSRACVVTPYPSTASTASTRQRPSQHC